MMVEGGWGQLDDRSLHFQQFSREIDPMDW